MKTAAELPNIALNMPDLIQGDLSLVRQEVSVLSWGDWRRRQSGGKELSQQLSSGAISIEQRPCSFAHAHLRRSPKCDIAAVCQPSAFARWLSQSCAT